MKKNVFIWVARVGIFCTNLILEVQNLFCIADRKRRRIQHQKESIFNQEPNAFEQKLIHNIFMKTMDINNKSFNVRNIPSGM